MASAPSQSMQDREMAQSEAREVAVMVKLVCWVRSFLVVTSVELLVLSRCIVPFDGETLKSIKHHQS